MQLDIQKFVEQFKIMLSKYSQSRGFLKSNEIIAIVRKDKRLSYILSYFTNLKGGNFTAIDVGHALKSIEHIYGIIQSKKTRTNVQGWFLSDEGVSALVQKITQDPDDDVKAIVALFRKGPLTLAEACNKLKTFPEDIERIVRKANANGYSILLNDGVIGCVDNLSKKDESIVTTPKKAGEKHVIACCSDIHIGSKHFMKDEFEDYIDKAYSVGARNVFVAGDLLDGHAPFLLWEQAQRGFTEQAEYAAKVLPKKQGLKYHFITGNHELFLAKHDGFNVGECLVDTFKRAGRNDLTHYGDNCSSIVVKGADGVRMVVELYHPGGSSPYALSYRAQKKIESYPPSYKPSLLLVGHFHTSYYINTRGVHCLGTGTFQAGQSAFSKMLSGTPATGAWIVEYTQTQDGTIRDFKPTWVGYFVDEKPVEILL